MNKKWYVILCTEYGRQTVAGPFERYGLAQSWIDSQPFDYAIHCYITN